ncbi:MAG TPA: S9 family peptidase [Anaerolineae bacterium]|nr:S9 family peptidase [Anaerolineae bacterium]HQK14205.1 S9 family peptidase [Anaerolineae bacterium]
MSSSSKISPDDVARYPLPGMAIPNTFAFSADDARLTYLHSAGRTLTQQLYVYDLATGATQPLVIPPAGGETEETLSPEEKLRRERARLLATGVTRYALSGQGFCVLVPLNGAIYIQDGVDAPLRQIVSNADGPALDPQFAPDGSAVAYVRDAELYVVPAEGGEPRQLTTGARETGRTHGLAEYIAQEEMHRSHGFWWSPDGQHLAFTEVDETHIPIYRIVHQGQDNVGAEVQEEHRYPFAGKANAKVRLGVVGRHGGAPVWMDLGEDDDIYLARVQWFPDGSLVAQVENREQTELRLLRFDPHTGVGTLLFTERSDVWINLHDMLTPLKDGRFVWAAERTGFRHLYLYTGDGQLIRQLTDGAWMVDTLAGIDEKRGLVYFTATKEHPTEQHLYVVSLEGGDVRRITRDVGMHTVALDHARRRFIDVHSTPETPPTVTLRDLADGTPLRVIYDTPDPRVAALGLAVPEIVAFQNCDGDTLYGALYLPPAEYGPGPYPVIVNVYGGPHAQCITRSWALTVDMRAQYLSSLGFLVFKVDNRGSARRGLAFEGAIKHHLGDVEVRDQVDGLRWLVGQGLADPARVGIYGWSYGGYMAAMSLARAPETFKVAVAGAPVTHWDGYDTHYTERYMGTPQSNPEGYAASSVMAHVDKIQGKLLLVHGLIDENVHFRHTARLINALIRARKPYALLLFPDERHSPRRLADRIYMEERVRDFFLENL